MHDRPQASVPNTIGADGGSPHPIDVVDGVCQRPPQRFATPGFHS